MASSSSTTTDTDSSLVLSSKRKRSREGPKKKKKEKKQKKEKEKKHRKKNRSDEERTSETYVNVPSSSTIDDLPSTLITGIQSSNNSTVRPIVESSALCDFPSAAHKNGVVRKDDADHSTTLLLFYQYIEPHWSPQRYTSAKQNLLRMAEAVGVSGRMRIAREGLNCTLTGTVSAIGQFCTQLRAWDPVFLRTEFKLTHDLPNKQRFRELKLIPVLELVHYGLEGDKAPSLASYQGTHLEPKDYHKKLTEEETVVIDVRNHYEAVIGRFAAPNARWIDPKMRKSTDFPAWLDDPKTRMELANKQVLMYCTGGIRCERASALLRYKMENDPDMAELNIKGVYQLQGGVDKYFKEFPDGGYWKGKNYVFDKRFAHTPPALVNATSGNMNEVTKSNAECMKPSTVSQQSSVVVLGKCECCKKPWDMFRGKRRCPACGVPSLICKECWKQSSDRSDVLANVRCDLCVEQNIYCKRDLRAKDQKAPQFADDSKKLKHDKSLNQGTRLFLKNMCTKSMTDEVLMNHLPGITHIVWKLDYRSKDFLGSGWIELDSTESAAKAVAKSGQMILGRKLFIEYQPPDVKDKWPPLSSAVIV